ncbi:hypothetical protein N2152v2_008385 [Parachlorella kessleri]
MQRTLLPQKQAAPFTAVQQQRPGRRCAVSVRAVAAVEAPASTAGKVEELPLMLRALKGESVERPPVWMMRQAGRYMKVYQELCKKHTTFRERSENVDIAQQGGRIMPALCSRWMAARGWALRQGVVEVSLQPWRAFQPDGVILFSDILTPIAGMNIPFDITAGKGPVIFDPIRTMDQVKAVTPLVPQESVPFVGEALTQLRQEVGSQSTVLGFVGAPFTLATYIVEGGMSKNYTHIKKLMFSEPLVLHGLLQKLADSVVTYIKYQGIGGLGLKSAGQGYEESLVLLAGKQAAVTADAGAQAVQIFDSWAANLSPMDFDVFAGPYLHYIIKEAKEQCPDLPIILYISGSGALLERMAACNPDIISLCNTVDMTEGIARCGSQFAYQGNMDPGVLFGSHETIEARVIDTVQKAKAAGVRHVMNLGHGVMQGTPEDHVRHFFEVAKTVHQRLPRE